MKIKIYCTLHIVINNRLLFVQPQTQYMLATNQQGQTYLVAQQQPPPVNQILLTQTSQQQGGAPTKTIIILQQQTPTTVNTGMYPKKSSLVDLSTYRHISIMKFVVPFRLVSFHAQQHSERTTKGDHDHTTGTADDCDTSTTSTSCHCQSTFRKWFVFHFFNVMKENSTKSAFYRLFLFSRCKCYSIKSTKLCNKYDY